MEIIDSLNNAGYLKKNKVSLALGNFDGVHKGHAEIIKSSSRNIGKSGAVIFDPHPALLLFPDSGLELLTTLDEKIRLLRKAGLDFVIIQPFTEKFAFFSPREFVEYLQAKIAPEKVIIGFDYNFGHLGKGNAKDLELLGNEYGFAVEIIPPVSIDGTIVGSTLIRRLLANGDIAKANRFLGYNFTRSGRVLKGRGRGKTIGVPTINLPVKKGLCYPRRGVYLVKAKDKNFSCWGIANIGICPTFGNKTPSLEVHLIGAEGDFYNKKIEVMFLKWIREEKHFVDSDALTAQIKNDLVTAKKYIKEYTETAPSRQSRKK